MRSLKEVQIDMFKLQREIDAIREAEKAGVVDRIREAIHLYALTPEDLFSKPKAPPLKHAGNVPPKTASKALSNGKRVPAYRDDSGNTWGGMGPRPMWLRTALAAGKSLDDFRVSV